MRRRRFRLAVAAVAVSLAAVGFGSVARAQTSSTIEGALAFLLPVGARSIGMGQAVVALSAGSEGLWWNPALLARSPRDLSAHIASNFGSADGGADFAAAVVFPLRGVGALGIGVHYLNSGQIDNVDRSGEVQTGTFQQRTTSLVATFAAPFGDRFSAGVSLKFLQLSYPCTGICDLPTTPPTTGAIDVGMQYIAFKDSTVMFGAAVRSLGPKLQVTDSPQADALPSRLDVGVSFSPRFSDWPKEIRVRGAADIVSAVAGAGSPGYRVGAEVGYFERLYARAGYVVNDPNGSGPTLGFGFVAGRVQIDFAQSRTDVGSLTGKQPTYLSMRYSF